MIDFLTWLYYAPDYIELIMTIGVISLFALPFLFTLRFEDIMMLVCTLGVISILYF